MEQQEEIVLSTVQDAANESKSKPLFASFIEQLAMQKDNEEKIRFSLQFMQQCLSCEGPPSFKDFWEARKLSLALFKENLNPKARSQLWEKYMGLTSEAYHLKEMMDSESSFAKEQIETAIKGIESNLQNVSALLHQIPSIEIPEECGSILTNIFQYHSWYQELHLTYSFAEQIHALRKEILKTEMRFRFKNKLLDQLTKIGDIVFPRRKELVESLATAFLIDIEKYMGHSFSQELNEAAPFALKDTIKALQYVVKQLYLSHENFAKAKNLLSIGWEKIQEKDKERKSEYFKKKEVQRSNHEQISKKFQELEERYANGALQEKDLDGEYEQLQLTMRNLDLGKDEIRSIKQSFQQIKNRFTEKLEKEIKEGFQQASARRKG